MKTMQESKSAKNSAIGFLATWGSTIFGLILAGVLLGMLTK